MYMQARAGAFLIAPKKLYLILTHLAYIANAKKPVISNKNSTVLKAQRKHMLADINCHRKMISAMALDSVTSF